MRGSLAVWMAPAAGMALFLAACLQTDTGAGRGRALFDDFCVTCHGAGGRGDGPLAADWTKPPADLTAISRGNGGVFPLARVMSQIDGYARRKDVNSVMPEMGPVFAGSPTVTVDTGDGIETPVPEALLDLALYVRSLQE